MKYFSIDTKKIFPIIPKPPNFVFMIHSAEALKTVVY